MAHLRPNMIYDLVGELHVMIERVDQGFGRSRKIAARPRTDSDADRLLHTSLRLARSATLSRGYGLQPATTSLRNHRAAPDGARGEFIPLKVDLLLLS